MLRIEMLGLAVLDMATIDKQSILFYKICNLSTLQHTLNKAIEIDMDINRCKLFAVSLFMIAIYLCILPLSIHATSRGITVKAKTSSGAVKEIQLYSGYHALVVGVSDYDSWPDLPYATKDAQDVAQALKKMGFTVTTIFNPSSRDLTKALNRLTYKYGRESDRAILFFYAGHGETEKLADGTKLGYIIPKDCPLLKNDPEGFVNKAVSMKDIEAYSLRIRSKHVLMLFDSCFSGSLFSLVRAVPEDITEKSTLPVRQYITAGTEDEAVPDRSMFKRCLLLGLEGDADLTRDGYITGTELGLYLSDKVIQNTRRAQHPQYGKIRTPELARGDFIFRLASSGAVVDQPGPDTSKAYLSVKSNVSGAKVFVDGRYLGVTNLPNIKISAGKRRVHVEKDGYEPYSKWVRFKAGRSMSLNIFLDKKPPPKSNLYVDTYPKDARVRILNINPKFIQGISLDTGHYHVEVSAKGYETKKIWVSLTAGQDQTIIIRLKPISMKQPVVDKSKKTTKSLSSEVRAKKIGRDMLNDGLVAYYPFDGDAIDASGNLNNGTEYGGVTYSDGIKGQAASFDGLNDFISTPNTFNFSDWSVAYWIKPEPKIGDQYIFHVGPGPSAGYETTYRPLLGITGKLENYAIRVWGGNSGTGTHFMTDKIYDYGKWVSICHVHNASKKITRLYMNGTLILTGRSQNFTDANNDCLSIGKLRNHNNNYFKGMIDEIYIYDRVISECEMREHAGNPCY